MEVLNKLKESQTKLYSELSKVIVGQNEIIEHMFIALLCRGHVLLEGVPGLAKTLLVSSIADCLSLSFKRIQFTPDLMPSDITGSELLQDDPVSGQRKFQFSKGPIFANMILADEINRTPPKTQAALLEAMQEKKVSAGGDDYILDPPFFVLATQNPLEQEGTYALPEAQLDRFMFKIHVDYPTFDEEIEIMESVTSGVTNAMKSVLKKAEIIALQDVVSRIHVTPHLFQYVATLVRNTRPDSDNPIDVVKNKLMAQSDAKPIYKSTSDCIKQIWKQEGYRGFFVGFSPCLIRSFPANGRYKIYLDVFFYLLLCLLCTNPWNLFLTKMMYSHISISTAAAFLGFEIAMRILPD